MPMERIHGNRKRLVVLTGAGMSAESGIMTFRDENGRWRQNDWRELACADAFARNHAQVLDFYNDRRSQLAQVSPNRAHLLLAELEKDYEVYVITQNVDDLHERAGSSNVLHLHGSLTEVTSSEDPQNPSYVKKYPLETPILVDDKASDGSALRPNVVWFGEPVSNIVEASRIIEKADVFVVIGTSLKVRPAADLLMYCPFTAPFYVIDPKPAELRLPYKMTYIREPATVGVESLIALLADET